MPSIVIVGAQWGDEGKGKLVDYLTAHADLVVRFQGGNNAGHTLLVDGTKYKLSLIPSGILHEKSRCALAAGVVIDPLVLKIEIAMLQKHGVTLSAERLKIDYNAHLILPTHIALDQAREVARGEEKIGTTGRGIGPAYEDRAARTGVRVAELFSEEALKEKLQRHVEGCNQTLKHVTNSESFVTFESVWAAIEIAREVILPLATDVGDFVEKELISGARVVFEGAQGTLLDNSFGTVPFVTSSNTVAGAVLTGVGLGPKRIDHVLAVAKAYSTRVGSGPFPTELNDVIGEGLRARGAEFGTVTGRPRRCGWFDAVAMRRAVRLNGTDAIALTKLDVLSGLETVKICIGYKLGARSNGPENWLPKGTFPPLAADLELVAPEYIEVPGWSEDISKVKKWHQLPSAAKLYVSTISELLGVPITIVSVGPEREATLLSKGAEFIQLFLAPKFVAPSFFAA